MIPEQLETLPSTFRPSNFENVLHIQTDQPKVLTNFQDFLGSKMTWFRRMVLEDTS